MPPRAGPVRNTTSFVPTPTSPIRPKFLSWALGLYVAITPNTRDLRLRDDNQRRATLARSPRASSTADSKSIGSSGTT
jgi:hypothetical protein